jgi:hypothetical protein
MAKHEVMWCTFSVSGECIVVVAMFGMTRTAKAVPVRGEATHVLIEKCPQSPFKASPANEATSPASTSPRAELDRLPRDLLPRR